MRKLKIGILDLVANRSQRTLWSRTMNPNFASILLQTDFCHNIEKILMRPGTYYTPKTSTAMG